MHSAARSRTPTAEIRRAAQILVVDDAPTIRRFLELLLEEAGYSVSSAADAEAALRMIDETVYQLVIVDKNLEGQDGFAVCRQARERSPETACMLITADKSVASAARAVEEEISAYLLKPLRREPVLHKVRHALERVWLFREREEARAELQEAKEALELRSTTLERALEQLVKTQRHLTESEKQVSLGMLAAGVAHEINNPACFILPNLDYLKRVIGNLADKAREAGASSEDVDDDLERGERMVDRCLEGINRIVSVVQTLQLFSRRDGGELGARVDLASICRSLLDLVTHELDGHATLEVSLEPVEPVLGNAQQLGQALLDLLLNARRSVLISVKGGDGGLRAVDDDAQSAGEALPLVRLSTRMDAGDVVVLVEDCGPALASKDEENTAFEPFFGGGSLTEGPGLHLSLAREVVDRHGGDLRYSREEGVNRLEARLPCAPADAPLIREVPATTP